MTISFDLWLMASSCVLATMGCFAASLLVGRLQSGRGTAWTWLMVGVPTLGLALWAVHFTALLAVQMPIGATFDLPLTLWSIEPTIMAAAVVLWLGREGHLRGARLLGAIVALTAGAAATRYFGLAAVRIVSPMQHDWLVFASSIALAAAVAYAALQYAARWIVGASLLRKLGVCALIGAAVSAAQYLGLAAARIEPSPFSKMVSAKIDHAWLGYTVACSTVSMLIALSVIVLLYARSPSRTKVMHARELAG